MINACYQQFFPKNLIPWWKFFFKNVIYYVSEAKCGSTWAAKWTIFVLNRVRVGRACRQSSSQLLPPHFSFQPLSNPFGGFHGHAIQKNHNHSTFKGHYLWNKRRQIFKKPHQELGICHCSYARCSEMCFPKFLEHCMETPCWYSFMGQTTATSVFEFCYKSGNSLLEEVIKIKVIYILRQGLLR